MKLSVIITTYNKPAWLEKVFWGYENQTDADFEVVVADDGSGSETRELIERFVKRGRLRIQHVWHEDVGFRKTEILNKAIVASEEDYLLFTDGDCIPRADFVQVHKERAVNGCFLSGGYLKLNMPVSEMLAEEAIVSQQAFDTKWLQKQGQPKSPKMSKLAAKGWKRFLLELLTPTKATWNGMNSSGWKNDITAVNGFNEQMQYGGLDREMGERMMNNGIKPKQIRYSAICIHLDHARGYATPESIQKNKAIRARVKREKLVWTDFGIAKER
ncbi:glycosyltransferase family 2 protein [Puniceicoccaceae bacterium K14]|nr:glycosyltransferase family 2 protein [Puniceicoccaceae bacterium K14]